MKTSHINITRDNRPEYRLMIKQAVFRAARGFNARFEYYSHYSTRKAAEDEL